MSAALKVITRTFGGKPLVILIGHEDFDLVFIVNQVAEVCHIDSPMAAIALTTEATGGYGFFQLREVQHLIECPEQIGSWGLEHTQGDTWLASSAAIYRMLLRFDAPLEQFFHRWLIDDLLREVRETPTRNGQVLDQTMQVLVSVGLATAFYAASAHTKALGLPERAREKYLEKALSPSMMAYAAISRSSHVGAPLGVANFISAPLGFDQAAMLRTSILPREKREQQAGRAIKYNPLQSDLVSGFIGGVAEQIPAANVAAHGVQAGYSAINLMGDQPRAEKQGHMTGLWNALRQFVPNDPLSQSLMQRLAEDQGVDRAR